MIQAGIIGGAGYTGGELLRLLIHHPQVEVAFVHSRSNAGKPVYTVHQDLIGETDLRFAPDFHFNIHVLILCVGHGEAKKFLTEHPVPSSVKIIDLSHDHRLPESSSNGPHQFVYGLPELQKSTITQANAIANPGCFATAIQLGLLPLAKAGLLEEVHTTGITGSTGAGQSFSSTSHFSWRANNIQAYKTLSHQHLAEIGASIKFLQPQQDVELNFVPWRGDFTRGIFISSQLICPLSQQELNQLYKDFYEDHPFTHVTEDSIFLKQVVNTNKCVVQPEKVGSRVVVHSAIDNLLKGASGQALQNLNLLFGLPETMGLQLKAAGF